GRPIGPGSDPRFLGRTPTLDLVFSSGVDLEQLRRLVYLQLNVTGSCPGGTVRLEAIRETPIPDSASFELKNAGGWGRDRSEDSLGRLVTVRPAEPLPLGCFGALVSPAHLDADSPGEFRRWAFGTYGPFSLASSTCGTHDAPTCPTGPISLS